MPELDIGEGLNFEDPLAKSDKDISKLIDWDLVGLLGVCKKLQATYKNPVESNDDYDIELMTR